VRVQFGAKIKFKREGGRPCTRECALQVGPARAAGGMTHSRVGVSASFKDDGGPKSWTRGHDCVPEAAD